MKYSKSNVLREICSLSVNIKKEKLSIDKLSIHLKNMVDIIKNIVIIMCGARSVPELLGDCFVNYINV